MPVCLEQHFIGIINFTEVLVVFIQSLLYFLALISYFNTYEFSKYCGIYLGALPVYHMLRTIIWCPFYFMWFKSFRYTQDNVVNFIGDSIYVYLYYYLFLGPASDVKDGLFSYEVQSCESLKHTFIYALCITWYYLCIIDVLLTILVYIVRIICGIFSYIGSILCPGPRHTIPNAYEYVEIRRYNFKPSNNDV
jgi:hypothetical protein